MIAAIRRVGRQVPGAAAVVAEHCTRRMTTTIRASRGSPGTTSRPAPTLVDALVGDAHRLLGHLPEQELDPAGGRGGGAAGAGRRAGRRAGRGSDGTDGRWRIARRVAADRVISTVDPEARHAHKTVHPPPGRVQGPRGGRARHRPDHRRPADRAAGPDNSDATVGARAAARRRHPTDRRTGAGLQVLADSAYGTGDACSPRWPTPGTPRSSSRGRCARPSRAGSPSTTSPSTDGQPAPSTCPAGHHPRRSPAAAHRHLRRRLPRLPAARPAAPPPAPAAPDTCDHARRSAPRPPRPRRRPDFQAVYRRHRPMVERSIAWLDPRQPPAALPRRRQQRPGCTPASPRSTCAACSPSASPARRDLGAGLTTPLRADSGPVRP